MYCIENIQTSICSVWFGLSSPEWILNVKSAGDCFLLQMQQFFFNIQCWNTWVDYMNNRNCSWLGDWIILIVPLCPRPHISWEWDFILVFWLNSDLDITVTFGSHLLCGILMVFLCVYPHRSCIRIYFTTRCLTSPWS